MDEERYTEHVNELSRALSDAPPRAFLRQLRACDAQLFTGFDGHAALADDEICDELERARAAIAAVARARVVLLGSGTSGRLAHWAATTLCDADDDDDEGVTATAAISGGVCALVRSDELPEDDAAAGAAAVRAARANVVVGVSCGLSSDYVAGGLLAALDDADVRVVVAVGFNRAGHTRRWRDALRRTAAAASGFVLTPVLGGEAVAGSSRMKGGTATAALLYALLARAAPPHPIDAMRAARRFIDDAVYARALALPSSALVTALTRVRQLPATRRVVLVALDDATAALVAVMACAEMVDTYGFAPLRHVALVAATEAAVPARLGVAAAAWAAVLAADDDAQLRALSVEGARRLGLLTRDALYVHLDATSVLDEATTADAPALRLFDGVDTADDDDQVSALHRLLLRKLWLDALTTASGAAVGAVRGNRMINMTVANAKLRARAIELVATLADVDTVTATRALRRAAGVADDDRLALDDEIRRATAQRFVIPRALASLGVASGVEEMASAEEDAVVDTSMFYGVVEAAAAAARWTMAERRRLMAWLARGFCYAFEGDAKQRRAVAATARAHGLRYFSIVREEEEEEEEEGDGEEILLLCSTRDWQRQATLAVRRRATLLRPAVYCARDVDDAAAADYLRRLSGALPATTRVLWAGDERVNEVIDGGALRRATTQWLAGRRLVVLDACIDNHADATRVYLAPLRGRTPRLAANGADGILLCAPRHAATCFVAVDSLRRMAAAAAAYADTPAARAVAAAATAWRAAANGAGALSHAQATALIDAFDWPWSDGRTVEWRATLQRLTAARAALRRDAWLGAALDAPLARALAVGALAAAAAARPRAPIDWQRGFTQRALAARLADAPRSSIDACIDRVDIEARRRADVSASYVVERYDATQHSTESLYEVCLRTGDNGDDGRALLDDDAVCYGELFVRPYLEPAEVAYVARRRADGAVCGYALATRDSARLAATSQFRWVTATAAAAAGELDALASAARRLRAALATAAGRDAHLATVRPFFARYPAHLHIDLLREAQGGGLGRRMLAAVMRALAADAAVSGVHLVCAASNARARHVYASYLGMRVLHEDAEDCVMGVTLVAATRRRWLDGEKEGESYFGCAQS